MLLSIAAANFKAIGSTRLELELAPLTLLVGPNGAGKSSALEAFALLAQSTRPSKRTGLNTTGRLVSLGDERSLYHRKRTDQQLYLAATWRQAPTTGTYRFWLAVQEGHQLTQGHLSQGISEGDASSVRFYKKLAGTGGGYRTMTELRQPSLSVDKPVGGNIERFLDEGLFYLQEADAAAEIGLAPWRIIADRFAAFVASPDVRYVAALRGGALIAADAKGSAATAGRHGENTLRLLNLLQARGDKEQKQLMKKLAERFGLHDLSTGSVEEALEATFEDPFNGTRLSFEQAGFGSQQALPVIADLAASPPETVLFFEEIEHSCHPSWVETWGTTLAEVVAKRHVQIVATTHAPDLVLAVALAVKQGILAPDQVVIHEFRRDEGGVSAVRRALDERGHFEGGYPQTFARAVNNMRLWQARASEEFDSRPCAAPPSLAWPL